MLRYSEKLIDFIKAAEGFVPVAKHLSIDRPDVITGGYGQTGLHEGQVVSEREADKWLRAKIDRIAEELDSIVKVDVTVGQIDALVDFAYNLGVAVLKKSQLMTYLNRKQYTQAANEFSRWVYANGKLLEGLAKRRAQEAKWFRGSN